jgi:hypothetical protein
MRGRPKGAADSSYSGLTRKITGLQQISDRHIIASSEEGKLAIWDINRAEKPLHYITTPDGQ